jgi:hypothetical protein
MGGVVSATTRLQEKKHAKNYKPSFWFRRVRSAPGVSVAGRGLNG